MPLPGSATKNKRTPSTLGGYTYWITATVDGAETAPSNTAGVTLPFGSDGDHGSGTPAAILNIGTGATQNHFNVGIGYPESKGGHLDRSMTEIIEGYVDPLYFRPNANGDAVAFSVRADGKTTSNQTPPAVRAARDGGGQDDAEGLGLGLRQARSRNLADHPPAARRRSERARTPVDLLRTDPRHQEPGPRPQRR